MVTYLNRVPYVRTGDYLMKSEIILICTLILTPSDPSTSDKYRHSIHRGRTSYYLNIYPDLL